MIRAFLLALLAVAPAAAQVGPPPPDPALSETAMLERRRYDGCVRAIQADATKAEQFAVQWAAQGGGLPARHCQALAQLQLRQFKAAATTLADAARDAETAKSPLAADFWGQAGNAAFLAGDNKAAIAHFTAAIAANGEFAPQRAAAFHVDRARAQAELGDLAATRADLDRAVALNDQDAVAWMLSAALARRQGDMARASNEIARASAISPSDPDIMFEQANIAAANGDIEAAKKVWAMTVRAAPGTPAAELSAEALKRN
jgi:predicted Zn-dependent protease